MLIPPTFQYATHFRDGLALVKQNGKWGYIDSTGAWIVPPKFDNAQPFSNQVAYVFQKGKTGVIDRRGNFLAEPIYDSVTETDYGIEIRRNGKCGLISEKYGKLPIEYIGFDALYNAGYLFAQRSKNNFDLYYHGTLVAKNVDRSDYFGDYFPGFGLLIVSVGGKEGVLNASGEWIIRPEYANVEYLVVGGVPETLPEHATKGNGQLFKLEQWIMLPDSDPIPVYYLARMDGSRISEQPFSYAELITHDYWEELPNELSLRQDGKIVYLNPDMTIRRTPGYW